MFNRKLDAQEALGYNLVTEVVPHAEFEQKAWQRVEEFSKLPKESLLESRRVLRSSDVEALKKANRQEVQVLVGRWSSAEFMRVITEFWKPKTKL
jgi:enoyl-CoA hydratase/carnithine racemase